MDENYFEEMTQLRKTRHRRTKSRIEKISRIIKDAEDLNEIL